MVTGAKTKENGEKKPKGATRSWGNAASGHSVSTSGSVGSPSSRSEAGMTTPAGDTTFHRLSHLEIQGDDAGSQVAIGVKKKRGQRAAGGDKSGRGLRQFSMKVCEKVESKGRTTYNEVADELVAEFAEPGNGPSRSDQQYDEKNIRRRVYDALNVLMAMDIISKDKKEIQWRGLPRTSPSDIEHMKVERIELRNRIEKRAAYLQELEEQYIGFQNLIHRNQRLYGSGNGPSAGVALPFILVQTRPNATVEVEISEDMQLVHFDFNSTPFELHDDNYVLKKMKFCEKTLYYEAAAAAAAQSLPGPGPADGGEGGSSLSSTPYQPQFAQPPLPNPNAAAAAAAQILQGAPNAHAEIGTNVILH